MLSVASKMFSNIVAECFIGKVDNATIKGRSICDFICAGADLVGQITRTPAYLIFGNKYCKLSPTSAIREYKEKEVLVH